MNLTELKETFQEANWLFTDDPTHQTLTLPRRNLTLVFQETIYAEMRVTMYTRKHKICFYWWKPNTETIRNLETLCDLFQQLHALHPTWSSTFPRIMLGKKPGDPVLQLNLNTTNKDAFKVYTRPASINSLSHQAPIKTFPANTRPATICAFIRKQKNQQTPALTWEAFAQHWNQQHSQKLGCKLTCSPSYLYALNGVRFLTEGKDLFLEVFLPLDWRDFPKLQAVLTSIQKEAQALGLYPKEAHAQ